MKSLFTFPKKLLIALIRNPQLVSGIGLFCLMFLIWFGGPRIGLHVAEDRLLIIIAILFLGIVFLLLGRYRESSEGKYLEQALQEQAESHLLSSRPDRREEIKVLKEELDKAIYALKHSKLGKGRRGSAALYALPWYMFIGPSASGKSTALQHSGLHFPYLGASGRGIQGVGGTRNCDWWFTSDAILLDTAGRYVSEEEDREEWFGFLSMLKKARKKKPINGVLAAISISDLYQADEEEIERHARNIRERIDELTERLGILFPVYLVFTKCDLLQGFVEFFEDLNKRDRDQIWGCTFPKKATSGASPHLAFETEFKGICEALNARRMARLSTARSAQKIRDIYAFPLQFSAGQENYSRFVEILFKENPYRDNPTFRGFYFTSGTQEGTPIDRIVKSVSLSSGLSSVMSDAFSPRKEMKSYFIKDLFTEVIFPDRHVAGVSSAMTRQRGALRVAVFAAAVLFTLGSVTALIFSFLGNKNLTRNVRADAFDAAQMIVSDSEQIEHNMVLLEGLRARLAELQTHEQTGVPVRLRLGLYQGNKILPALRTLYFNRFNTLILSPALAELKKELRFFARRTAMSGDHSQTDTYYDLLKIYLMILEPKNLDPVLLADWFHKTVQAPGVIGARRGPMPEDLRENTLAQVDFYIAQLAKGHVPVLEMDQPLVRSVRNRLLKTSVGERLYVDIKSQGAKDISPYSLSTAMEAAPQNFVASTFQIPGFFTKAGWDQFPDLMQKVLDGSSGEVVWVLGLQQVDREDMMADVEARYFEEYANYWQRFLESLQILPGKNLFDIEDKISKLTQVHSPLRKLLASVDENTYLFARGESKVLSGAKEFVEGAKDKVKKVLKLGRDTEMPESTMASGPANPVSRKFKSLHQFMIPAPGSDEIPLIEQYVTEIGKAHAVVWGIIHKEETGLEAKVVANEVLNRGENDLIQGARNTEKLLKRLSPASRTVLSPLFLEPFRMAAEVIMETAVLDLNRLWREEVYLPCRQNVMGRYPFSARGEDAAMDDVAAILQPDNGILWRFYEAEIKPFVEMKRNRFVPKKRRFGVSMPFSGHFLEGLQRARLISESLFEKGSQSPAFRFELYPIPSPGVSESIFVMDGKQLKYRNEPQDWYSFSWPGKAGPPGASLQIKSDETRQRRNFDGRWGLFKLFDQGEVIQINSNRYKVAWRFKRRPDNTIVKIEYDLRAKSHKNPLRAGLLRNFACPEKVGSI
ncbi:IcmF-related protein [hydrothermal vent metagenome]|uniref:IcmF-related protein n=1 Tax=hydrothermal vent metagenome TaxID=652676 RepID=A0A3B1CQS8_9ZZZZ